MDDFGKSSSVPLPELSLSKRLDSQIRDDVSDGM